MSQLDNSVYLTSMIQNLRRQRQEALRQNEVGKNMNLRLLKQTNALNGHNGGIEESSYARLLAGANKGRSDILAQFNPQIAQYKAYLAALSAGGSGSGGGGGRRRRKNSDTERYVNPNNGIIAAATAGYTAPHGPLWNSAMIK